MRLFVHIWLILSSNTWSSFSLSPLSYSSSFSSSFLIFTFSLPFCVSPINRHLFVSCPHPINLSYLKIIAVCSWALLHVFATLISFLIFYLESGNQRLRISPVCRLFWNSSNPVWSAFWRVGLSLRGYLLSMVLWDTSSRYSDWYIQGLIDFTYLGPGVI